MTGWHSGPDGTYAWREVGGVRVEIPTAEFLRELRWHPEPIYDQVLDDLGLCRNCKCADCGCCPGCGGVDADLDPPGSHGYVCVM
uniref:Uncharacterized protein n=1 Tax=Mycobacterium phage Pharb TaxID=3136626 RepID=A0AAU8GRK9_9VIRU